MRSAKEGDYDEVVKLLEKGADPNCMDLDVIKLTLIVEMCVRANFFVAMDTTDVGKLQ